MKLLPLIVMVLVAYDTRGCTPSADDMAGAGKISTTFSSQSNFPAVSRNLKQAPRLC
jgi:hypothetical protein